jgi:hypothetical protein
MFSVIKLLTENILCCYDFLRDIFYFRNTVDANPKWCCTYLLDPSDSLFIDVGQAFIRQQIKGIYLIFLCARYDHRNLEFVLKFGSDKSINKNALLIYVI